MIPSTELLAATVIAKAQEMNGVKNPYISFLQLETLCQGDELLEECLREVMNYSLRYAETVCRFEQIVARGQVSNEDDARKEIEQVRHNVHESTIDSINILSRVFKTKGLNDGWIVKVASCGRAGYAKFAILIAFELARR